MPRYTAPDQSVSDMHFFLAPPPVAEGRHTLFQSALSQQSAKRQTLSRVIVTSFGNNRRETLPHECPKYKRTDKIQQEVDLLLCFWLATPQSYEFYGRCTSCVRSRQRLCMIGWYF